MLQTNGSHITMHSRDYGIPLPFRVFGGEFLPTDILRFTVNLDGSEVFHKDFVYGEITNNAFILAFTKEESEKLLPGSYTWGMALVREDPAEDAQQNTFKGPCTLEVIGCVD
jgi:hypothetical protein